MTRDEMRGIAAKALHDAHWTEEQGEEPTASWESCVPSYRQTWFDQIDTVFAAIESTGHVIVPREPTHEMLLAGDRYLYDARWPDALPQRIQRGLFDAMLTAYGQEGKS